MKSASVSAPGYVAFVVELKARVASARLSAARAVNRDLILLYWDIGRGIVEKQRTLGWGESVVEQVAADLRRAFPEMRGFSTANIWRIRQLYLALSEDGFLAQAARETGNGRRPFLLQPVADTPSPISGGSPRQQKPEPAGPESSEAILAQLVRELASVIPWGHHVLLLGRIKSAAAHFYYLRATARFGWSRNVLLNQIKAGAYERSVTERKRTTSPLHCRNIWRNRRRKR